MYPNRALWIVMLVGALAGCRGGSAACCPPVAEPRVAAAPVAPAAARESAAGVPAKRYRTCVAEGTWEAVSSGGRAIEELYFPERGVVANLVYELQKDGEREVWKPVLNAFRGEIRNEYGPWCGPNAAPSPVEDVEVPAPIANAIFEAAELRGRADEAGRAAANRLSASGILRTVPATKAAAGGATENAGR